jgi:hypothetical protein
MREILLAKAENTGNIGELGGAKVILAEAAVDYLAESSFDNLLDLERYIASVVQAVVLIVESPGSMCELGAFVMTPEICAKLIIVMQSEYIPLSSFITSGALKYFKYQQQEYDANDRVLGYEWNIDNKDKSITVQDYIVDNMLNSLTLAMDAIHSNHATETFKYNIKGHIIFLTLAFCHLLRAAKQVDLKKCFEASNIKITEVDLKHQIDILAICGLIKQVRHGKLDYYVAKVGKMPLEIAFQENIDKADRNTPRWIARIVDALKSDKEEKFRIEMFNGVHNV